MRSFNMGRFGNSDDPWFRVGTVDVNTTIFVVGVGVLSLLLWAVEGPSHPILGRLVLIPSEVMDGQVWRLFTWPIANEFDSIWVLLLFFVFFQLGSMLEATMGRKLFTTYLVLLALVPAAVVMVFHILVGTNGGVGGLRMIELGVLVGFGLRMPDARFWPGIPAWGIAAGIVVINMVQYLGVRDNFSMLFLATTVVVALIGLRSLGFAEHADWVPRVPLPASGGGAPKQPKSRSTSKRKRRSRANLKVAPAPNAVAPPRRELTKLEEAEMDSILDQVSERGMDSLTPQQRKRLEDHSKRLRRGGD
ncbi:hypothetical protein N8342_10980 [Acidimicrobiales bacterium]|nr:hypothetical protein [Acidimicrobiales bacterium]MDC1390341.1 hypothetical protein [Acidimicrobiales bacterium]MDG1088275.1 hypothetical protein [Acidimicrobiales bacterium]